MDEQEPSVQSADRTKQCKSEVEEIRIYQKLETARHGIYV